MTTFGFECEFDSDPTILLNGLTSTGLCAEASLHPYHCECCSCDPYSSWAFRAQRDSSVSGGEIISRVFDDDDWDVALRAMTGLQQAAMDGDAAISQYCGLHVHLGNVEPPRPLVHRAWLAIEATLHSSGIAGGAWATGRGMNMRVASRLVDAMAFAEIWFDTPKAPSSTRSMFALLRNQGLVWIEDKFLTRMNTLIDNLGWMDRHSDFAPTHHGGQFEVRVFNGTRVAWRMELACRLAVALVIPTVTRELARRFDTWLAGDTMEPEYVDALVERLRWMGSGWASGDSEPPVETGDLVEIFAAADPRLGELLMKQTGYSVARRAVGCDIPHLINNKLSPGDVGHDAVLARISPA